MDHSVILIQAPMDDVSLGNIKKSMGENPESRFKCLQSLRKKLSCVEGLQCRMDDDFLLRSLRIAKFDVSKAFDRIRKYYQSRRKYPHIFSRLHPSQTLSAQPARHFHASPLAAEDGSLILYHRRGLFDPRTMDYEEMFMLDLLVLEHLVRNPVVQLCGVTIIMDFEGYGMQHVYQDSPKRILMCVDVFQHTYPIRFKSIHVVNAPSIFTVIYSICYPFLTKKITSRLHFHSNKDNWKSLHSLVSPQVLSENYGGKIPKEELIDLVEEVNRQEDYFRLQLQYGFTK